MRACPKCGNTGLITERRMNGKSTCIFCKHEAPTIDFPETKQKPNPISVSIEQYEASKYSARHASSGHATLDAALYEIRKQAFADGFEAGFTAGGKKP